MKKPYLPNNPRCFAITRLIMPAFVFGHLMLALPQAGSAQNLVADMANQLQPQVVSGNVSFNQSNANTLEIHNSPDAIINWQDFSIDSHQSAVFVQQHAQSSVLNRVIGENPSQILGNLISNGKVFLINPNGVVFAADAVVDTAGLIVSTLNLSDEDFLAKQFKFQASGKEPGGILNKAYIRTSKQGEVVFIAPTINNQGLIETTDGNILLLAGESIVLNSLDNEGVSIKLSAPANQVLNLGKLIAQKGSIGLFADVIAQQGSISANTLVKDASGQVKLLARSELLASEESQIINQGGEVVLYGLQKTQLAGHIQSQNSQGQKAAAVTILGEEIILADGQIDVSSASHGGKIYIGGDYQGKGDLPRANNTRIDKSASLSANAGLQGDGGQVIVWSDQATQMNGNISATGGAQGGNGGFVEVSSKQQLSINGLVDLSAAQGQAGQLELDPEAITIVAVSEYNEDDPNNISIEWVQKNLETSSLNIVTSEEDIVIATPIEFNSPNTLMLSAGNNIDVRHSIDGGTQGSITLNTYKNIINSSGTNVSISGKSVNLNSIESLSLESNIMVAAKDTVIINAAETLSLNNLISASNVFLKANSGSIKQSNSGSIQTTGTLTVDAKGDVELVGNNNNFHNVSINTTGANVGGNVTLNHQEQNSVVSYGITTPIGAEVKVETPVNNVITDNNTGTGSSTGNNNSSDDSSNQSNSTDPVSFLLTYAALSEYQSEKNKDEYKQSKVKSKKKKAILHCSQVHH